MALIKKIAVPIVFLVVLALSICFVAAFANDFNYFGFNYKCTPAILVEVTQQLSEEIGDPNLDVGDFISLTHLNTCKLYLKPEKTWAYQKVKYVGGEPYYFSGQGCEVVKREVAIAIQDIFFFDEKYECAIKDISRGKMLTVMPQINLEELIMPEEKFGYYYINSQLNQKLVEPGLVVLEALPNKKLGSKKILIEVWEDSGILRSEFNNLKFFANPDRKYQLKFYAYQDATPAGTEIQEPFYETEITTTYSKIYAPRPQKLTDVISKKLLGKNYKELKASEKFEIDKLVKKYAKINNKIISQAPDYYILMLGPHLDLSGLPESITVEKPRVKVEKILDSDNDGVPDEFDICPKGDDNIDLDKDGVPDACDKIVDSDFDNIPDYFDQCPNTRKGAVTDNTGCEIKVEEKPAIIEEVKEEMPEEEVEIKLKEEVVRENLLQKIIKFFKSWFE